MSTTINLREEQEKWIKKNVPERGLTDFLNNLILKEMGMTDDPKKSFEIALDNLEVSKARLLAAEANYIAILNTKRKAIEKDEREVQEQTNQQIRLQSEMDRRIESIPGIQNLLEEVRNNISIIDDFDVIEKYCQIENGRVVIGISAIADYLQRNVKKEEKHGIEDGRPGEYNKRV
jgi:hypothetical protein